MKLTFWVAAVVLLYTYVGYPALLWIRSRLSPRPVRRASYTPSISVVLVVLNEAPVLEKKLGNLLSLRYPSELLEIVVASDGSTDGTNAILADHAKEPRLRVLYCPQSRGKAAVLNDAIGIARGEILVFTDARQHVEADAVRLLAENFADPAVGCVSGALMLGDPQGGESSRGMGTYWSFEKVIRQLESASGSTVGATGAFYAVKRNLCVPIPQQTILDDVYLPMNAARQGLRVVFDSRARVWDQADLGRQREFARKVRTLSGNYQLVQLAPWLLSSSNPIRFGFISHKLLRLVVPFALVALLLASLGLGGLFYRAVLVGQLVFYGLSALALSRLVKDGILVRIADAAGTFVLLNGAAVVALANFVTGRRAAWTR
jgi:cellulose synthase/poly-beta-1,6-N-acetylglucosamine synthase-like glycosyltransferase